MSKYNFIHYGFKFSLIKIINILNPARVTFSVDHPKKKNHKSIKHFITFILFFERELNLLGTTQLNTDILRSILFTKYFESQNSYLQIYKSYLSALLCRVQFLLQTFQS